MANANFFSPDGGITRYPLEDTEGRIMYGDGIDGINLFSVGLHVDSTYYLKQDSSFILPAGNYILSFKNASNKTIKYWASSSSDLTDKSDKYISAGGTVKQAYTLGSGGNVEFAFRFDPQDSITTSAIAELMLTEAKYVGIPYRPYNQHSIQHQINDITGVTGVRNFLKIEASTQTLNGVTFTVNKDDNGNVLSVGMNGTATADVIIRLGGYSGSPSYDQQFSLPTGNYELVGCPSGGGSNTYYMEILRRQNSTASRTILGKDFGNGFLFSCEDNNRFDVNIIVLSGQTVSNLIVKPMIRVASDPDDTYVPYAMTNRELTENVIPHTERRLSDFQSFIRALDNAYANVDVQVCTVSKIGKVCFINGRIKVPANVALNISEVSIPVYFPKPSTYSLGLVNSNAQVGAQFLMNQNGKMWFYAPASSGAQLLDYFILYIID